MKGDKDFTADMEKLLYIFALGSDWGERRCEMWVSEMWVSEM